MYVKVFNQIFDSSIVEKPETRFTFVDMLILADVNGVIDMTHEAIARRTNRPLELIRQTITELEGPDPRSRTPDYEGARIKRLDDHRDWGWYIVNYEYFRKLARDEQRREKTRIRVQKHRAKLSVTQCNAPLRTGNDFPSASAYTSSSVQKEEKSTEKRRKIPPSIADAVEYGKALGMTSEEVESWYDHFQSNGWKIAGKAPMKDWEASLRTGARIAKEKRITTKNVLSRPKFLSFEERKKRKGDIQEQLNSQFKAHQQSGEPFTEAEKLKREQLEKEMEGL